MAQDDALHNGQGSTWQLLLQFVAPGGPGSEHQAVERVAEAVEELGLQAAERERIEKAVFEAVRKARQWEKRDPHDPPVSIRVWISGLSTEDRWRSGSDARRAGRRKRKGWGFFLVQRQEGDLRASAGKPHHVVELYLYQER